jgi:glycosyltransferase involved in cell wall biosynthesis
MAKSNLQKNILITSANFPKGSAAANYLNLFCKGLANCGSETEVYILKGYFLRGKKTNDAKKNVTDYGVAYSYLGFVNRSSKKIIKIIGDLYGLFSLNCLLLSLFTRRENIKIFAYNNEVPNSLLLNLYCKLARIKLVTFVPEYYDISEFSGNLFSRMRWKGFLLNFNYINRLSDKLIVFSSYIKNKYIERKFPENKIMIQPNLTDFDFWDKNEKNVSFTIGYCGAPYKKDGIGDLLKAVSLLKKKNIEVRALIVGDVMNEKSIIPSLAEYCEKLGIRETITFTGHVPIEDVRDWLNKCEILAITRPNIVQTVAGFPTKIGEYFACRKTVLSTRIGDVANYFSDRQEIVFAESGNPQSIADNIEWILNNQDESRKIAMNGYIKAKELLNYKEKVPAMMEFVDRP